MIDALHTQPDRPLQRARLWISYHRYAFALAGLAAAMVAVAALTGSLIVWLLIAVPVIITMRFAIFVASRFGDKMRATRIAAIRIRQGRFRPEQIRRHCADPCFRVVAAECLARAGVEKDQRSALIRQYRDELRDAPATLLIRDPSTGRTILVGGDFDSNHINCNHLD